MKESRNEGMKESRNQGIKESRNQGIKESRNDADEIQRIPRYEETTETAFDDDSTYNVPQQRKTTYLLETRSAIRFL